MIRLPVREEKKARPAKKRPDTPPMTKGNMQVSVVSFAIIVAAVFVVLAVRLWYLQILTGTEYSIAARATQTLEVKDPAQRGVIRDRDGVGLTWWWIWPPLRPATRDEAEPPAEEEPMCRAEDIMTAANRITKVVRLCAPEVEPSLPAGETSARGPSPSGSPTAQGQPS